MSKQLIESIIDDNLVEAKDIFTERMEEILERKLYESKRMLQAKMDEALGGMSRAEIKAREDAGYVRASAPKEKGGLGLSPYDIGQEKSKGRLLKAAAKKKKVSEETLDEMRAPGEVPGSEVRKRSAADLRAIRSGLRALDTGKEGRQKYTKDYLSARKAQMAPKTSVSGTETQVSREMPKLVKPEVPRDMSVLAKKGKEPKALRKPDAPRNKDIISRYRSGLERAKDLQSRGSEGAVKRFKKAYGLKALPAQAATGLKFIKRGFEEIGRTGGSIS